MNKETLKKQGIFFLSFIGITWAMMSLLIFLFLKITFTWDKFFYYFLLSVLIGLYGLYLLNKGKLFSKIFFVLAYIVSFLGLYFGSTSKGSLFGEFAALILMIIPLVSISLLGLMIDINIETKKRAKAMKEVNEVNKVKEL